MKIVRTSFVDGKTYILDINVTPEEMRNYKKGMSIQEAMPNISSEEREFIVTGVTPEQWKKMFSDEKE